MNVCLDIFISEYGDQFIKAYKNLMNRIQNTKNQIIRDELWKHHNESLTKEVFQEQEEILSVYQPWSDKWSLGSIFVTAWVFSQMFYISITSNLGINPAFFQKELYTATGDLMREIVCNIDPELKEEWYVLSNPNQPKSQKKKRKEARDKVQDEGSYRKRDSELTTYSRWWIIVRILKYKETDFVNKILPQFDDGRGGMSIPNFSTNVLAPFDAAIKYEVRQGRPPKEK